LESVDGVMLGRAAYHNPWLLADPGKARAQVVHAMVEYAKKGQFLLRNVTRHMLGLYHGHPRARLWRRLLSDPGLRDKNDPALLLDALEAVESRAMMAA
jgi:tRNA-dihydrouridine synthase A